MSGHPADMHADRQVGARRSLEDLIKAYPNTEAAQAGKERLRALK